MKKIFIVIFALVLCKMSNAQYPISQSLGSDKTMVSAKGGLTGTQTFVIPSYADTTAANVGLYTKFYAGSTIFCTSDTSLYVRNKTAFGTYWFRIAGAGGGATGSNWAIGGNFFVVTPVNPWIGTNSPDNFQIATDATVRAIVPAAGFVLSSDTTATKILSWNPTTKAIGYSNWNNGGSGAAVDTSNKWVNTIYRIEGIDSFYYNIGGTVYAVKDSIGAGGGGVTSVATDDATGITGGTITTTGTLSIDTTIISTKANVTDALLSKEDVFTETVQEFTGSTSLTVTVSNTPKTSKTRIVFFNGVLMIAANVIISGSDFTISGITRETDDVITVKYSY